MWVEVLNDLIVPVFSAGYKLVIAMIALGCLRAALSWFDNKMEFSFKEWINGADSHSIAIYYAGRFIGACFLFGLIFS